jgi:hypothetical protein
MMAAVSVLAVVATACTSGHAGKKTAPASSAGQSADTSTAAESADPSTAAATAADTDLILTMYDTINQAFQRKPDDGVRAIIAAQDPEDRADVDFRRCVSLLAAGGKTLPASKKYHFTPNVRTTQPDPEYTVTSAHVKGLRPKGRIYVTDVTITDGGKARVSSRHQVILNGKAYQFSSC